MFRCSSRWRRVPCDQALACPRGRSLGQMGPVYKQPGCSLSPARVSATPRTAAHQAPPSLGFSRQEYWSGLPFPPPGDLPDPGIEPRPPVCPALQVDSLPRGHRESPYILFLSSHVRPQTQKAETPNQLVHFFLVKLNESSNQDVPTPAHLLQSGPKDIARTGLPGGSVVTNLRAGQETQESWVQSLGREDPLEEEMATHSSFLAWRIPQTVHGVAE